MDLKKEIMDFLQTKKDWDLIAKTYYIYIKLCKTFSYDYRYLFGTEEEKKEMPKLPNKSLAFVVALVTSIVVSNMFLQKVIMFVNAGEFGIRRSNV